MSLRISIVTVTAVTALGLAGTLPAQAAGLPGKVVAGPAGVQLVKPPAKVACPPATIAAGARMTAAARRAGVRSVKVRMRTYRRTWSAANLKRTRSVRVRFACGATVRVRYTVVRAGRKPLVRTFVVEVAKDPATSGDHGKDTGVLPEGQAPPGAQQGDPAAPGATWSAFVDYRFGGTRQGQTCAQVTNTVDGTRWGASTYCGDLRLDPFFVRTQVLTDTTHGGLRRLVLAGVADPAKVRGISVSGPDGTRDLALSPPQGRPETAGAFIAVWDAEAAVVDAITLTVRYDDGTSSVHPRPASINTRSADGGRLD